MNKNCVPCLLAVLALLFSAQTFSQDKSLVNTSASSHSQLRPVDMGSVQWTKGFWAERFNVCRETMVPSILKLYEDPEITHAFRNFEIAAGLKQGSHKGPSFHDGDYYKVLEATSAVYAITKDPALDRHLDEVIPVIAKCQREDGYLYTPVQIDQKNNPGKAINYDDSVHFEAYSLGHLMTAACVHYRATGKTSLLAVARKATDYLYNFYKKSSPDLARTAICPSHYMGVIEMYRTTKDPRYLELAKKLIDIRGFVQNGTDDNQDRIPFRQQTKAVGHAVRANYLYAGAADLYAETGEDSLMKTLDLVWNDVTRSKMYITGACGALYNGISPDGTTYNPAEIQQVQQAYGRDYQLPNFTAHNETCANIGNLLWNWRMLQVTGKAKYTDVLELALYNSVLSGISLDGKRFLYANPLSVSDDLPFKQRWSKDRVEYISISNCCPPNTVRTISEVNNYVYSISEKGLWFNLYSGNSLNTRLKDGSSLRVTQQTDYPWEGNIFITLDEVPASNFSLFFRIPGWTESAEILINGKDGLVKLVPGEYAEFKRTWRKGDKIEVRLPMPPKLIQANPLVEEARNQVAVKRGPIVYCAESIDFPKKTKIFDLGLQAGINLKAVPLKIDNSQVIALEGQGRLLNDGQWKDQLYREISSRMPQTVSVRLIPYYAWGNRGHTEMSVWMPLLR